MIGVSARCLGGALLVACSTYSIAAPLTISQVQVSPSVVESAATPVQVRFTVSGPGHVRVRFHDGRDLVVKTLDLGALPAGEHVASWDLKDDRGRPVPAEAYTYTLTARTPAGEVVYDLADTTGGQDLAVRDVRYDPTSRTVRYVLERPARVNVRFGMQNNGPLMRTLVNWVPRAAGLRTETWDGRDASGVLSLATHPRIEVVVQAFSLPDNTILVGPAPDATVLITDLGSAEKRAAPAGGAKRMYAHAQQPIESRGDYTVRLRLPESLPKTDEGVPIVAGGIVPVRLEVDSKDLARAIERRFEPVFFVDGQFVFENEVGFVPMTWQWDASAVNDGEHFLTVNVRGYEGNFGIASVRVLKRSADGR